MSSYKVKNLEQLMLSEYCLVLRSKCILICGAGFHTSAKKALEQTWSDMVVPVSEGADYT